MAAFELSQGGDAGVVRGEVLGERQQVVDQALYAFRAQYCGPGLDITQQSPPDLGRHLDVG